jgi:diguanylate cyclase (GGDEF)-like protein
MNVGQRLVSAHRKRLRRLDTERALMMRVLMFVFLAGGTLATVGSAAFPTDQEEVRGTLAVGLGALTIAGLIFAIPDRLPRWSPHAFTALGTVAISLGILVSADSQGDDEMYYLWVTLFSFYFFTRRQALAQLVFLSACYAGVVAGSADDFAQDSLRWITTVGSLLVAGLIVHALANRTRRLIDRLTSAARTDPLTGLLNRKGFNEACAAEVSRAARTGRRFALLVGDLDNFKQVNDRRGHHAGDEALERVSAILAAGTRGADRAARLGGEEFALLVPDADAAVALATAERVSERVREAFAGEPVPLTISFGIALYPDHGLTGEELLRPADSALYEAKAAGRDRSVVAPLEAERAA